MQASDCVTNADVARYGPGCLASVLPARHRADGVIVISLALSSDYLGPRPAYVPLVTVDEAVRGGPNSVIGLAGCRLAARHLLPLRQVLPIEVVQRGSSGRPAGRSRQIPCRTGSHSSLISALEAR